MLYVYSGTDREKARTELNKAVAKLAKKSSVTRITDANAVGDLRAALGGSGMFGEKKIVVLDGILANEEARDFFLDALPTVGKSEEIFFVLEEKLDAQTRKTIEKHAETSERFDAKKERKGGEIFALAHALRRGDKKALWVGYQRALEQGEAPEAIHGVLFWGAKDMLLRSRAGSPEHRRGVELVAQLAELPHEARRQGFDLEYALEHYILGINKS